MLSQRDEKTLWVIIIGPSAPRTRRPSCSVLESGVASRRDFVKCSERSSTPPIAAEPSFQATRGAEGTQGALPFDAQAWACCTPPRRSTSLDLQKISDKSAIKAATLPPLPADRRSHCRSHRHHSPHPTRHPPARAPLTHLTYRLCRDGYQPEINPKSTRPPALSSPRFSMRAAPATSPRLAL